MKIVLFSTFFPFRGGIAQFSAMLFRAIEKKNDVRAFTFKRQYPAVLFPGTSQYVSDDDAADPIDAVRVLDSINPITFKTTAKKINAFDPEVYISQYWMTFFGPAMAGVQKRLKKDMKRICIVHNMIPHEKRFFDTPANRMFLKNNDGFVVMNNTVRDDLLTLKPDAKYLELQHPVYNQFGENKDRNYALKELNLPTENNYLLFFGFIREYKGLDLLIEALSKLPKAYHLIVAGEVYGSFDSYADIIKKTNTSDRIHLFNEYIPDTDVKTYFSAADVCVLPYKSATQSGITAISYHFELPVIATDVGGLKENTEHLKTGLIVESPKSELIADAIRSYFDQGLYASMSQTIADQKNENSWESFAEKIIAFSKEL
jgi:glycosyltransferase involved in cell wall biosynthesis